MPVKSMLLALEKFRDAVGVPVTETPRQRYGEENITARIEDLALAHPMLPDFLVASCRIEPLKQASPTVRAKM